MHTRDVTIVGGRLDGRTYTVTTLALSIRIPVLTKHGLLVEEVPEVHVVHAQRICERCGEPKPRYEVRSYGGDLVRVHLGECHCYEALKDVPAGCYTVSLVPFDGEFRRFVLAGD